MSNRIAPLSPSNLTLRARLEAQLAEACAAESEDARAFGRYQDSLRAYEARRDYAQREGLPFSEVEPERPDLPTGVQFAGDNGFGISWRVMRQLEQLNA